MWEIVYYLLIVIALAVAIVGAAFVARAYISGTPPSAAFASLFAPKPVPRLDIVEQTNLDGRRRLVLVRRDDVEHLIMTGGPVDVVIETGIAMRDHGRAEVEELSAGTLSRSERVKAQTSGEA